MSVSLSTKIRLGLDELLAFRHLYRDASIVLMRWNKLAPLLGRADDAYESIARQLGEFARFVDRKSLS